MQGGICQKRFLVGVHFFCSMFVSMCYNEVFLSLDVIALFICQYVL